jgi:hypothetical protein
MKRILALLLAFMVVHAALLRAQPYCVSGRVIDAQTREPMAFATVVHQTTHQGTVVGEDGSFALRNLPKGKANIEVRLFGYVPQLLTFALTRDTSIVVMLVEQDLRLDEVTVTSQKQHIETTAYTVDRTSLDHNQIVNVSDVTVLLPGGKSQGDQSLIDDPRIALRSEGTSEMGNAAFGTAIEVDGQRLSNNAEMSETTGASTRTVTTSDIEEVEVITGIPSVEYGDLSNGMVKVKTRRGKTPYMVDVTLKPHTKLAALSKGFNLGSAGQGGILNVSYEWTQSVVSLTSPYTTYQRNGLALRYTRQFLKEKTMPLNFNLDVKGNLGGLNSEADPDAFSDTYTRKRDYALRSLMRVQWQVGRPWLSYLELTADASLEDKEQRVNSNKSSATSQPALHTIEQGYHIADGSSIIMGPTGYWYELAITDSKPVDLSAHLKAKWDHERNFGEKYKVESHAKAGVDYSASGNEGRGLYYDDMALAPTWREERYDTLPYIHNLAIYAEEQAALHLPRKQELKMSFGLREDMTHVGGSEYGTIYSLSPRGSMQYTLRHAKNEYSIHAGMGKSVKLPSMQVLYPSISYVDWQTFASGTTASGEACYAYYTQPTSALYNSELKWQYSLQGEVGVEARWGKTRLSLTYFNNRTFNPYIRTSVFQPFSYELTSPITASDFPIPSADRNYVVDPNTGKVTVHDARGVVTDQVLPSTTIRRYSSNARWVNGAPSTRQGIEWMVDFARIPALRTDIRWDGTFYHYQGVETTLVASHIGASTSQSDGQPYSYIGYYEGGASASNGSVQSQLNTNVTLTTHIPVIRLIVSLRFECSFYNMKRQLREDRDGHPTGIALNDMTDYFGTATDYTDHYVAVYPKYYSTWDDPATLRPFYDDLLSARDAGNMNLYNDLLRMVRKSNTNYYFNEDRISPYFAANINVTKEIGRYVKLSFFATNFWNNTSRVRSSQTDRRTTLYNSGRIPAFYYGLSLKVRL